MDRLLWGGPRVGDGIDYWCYLTKSLYWTVTVSWVSSTGVTHSVLSGKSIYVLTFVEITSKVPRIFNNDVPATEDNVSFLILKYLNGKLSS